MSPSTFTRQPAVLQSLLSLSCIGLLAVPVLQGVALASDNGGDHGERREGRSSSEGWRRSWREGSGGRGSRGFGSARGFRGERGESFSRSWTPERPSGQGSGPASWVNNPRNPGYGWAGPGSEPNGRWKGHGQGNWNGHGSWPRNRGQWNNAWNGGSKGNWGSPNWNNGWRRSNWNNGWNRGWNNGWVGGWGNPGWGWNGAGGGWYGGGYPVNNWSWWSQSAPLWGIASLATGVLIGALINNAATANRTVITVPNTAYNLDYRSIRPLDGNTASFSYASRGRNLTATADCRRGLLEGRSPAVAADAELLNAACQVAYGDGER